MPTHKISQAICLETRPKPGVSILRSLLGFAIPLVIGGYWPLYTVAPDLAGVILRPTVLGISLVLGLLSYRNPVTAIERKAIGILALLCAGFLAQSFTATDPVRALSYWLKLVALCVISFLLFRALRNPRIARVFGIGLIVASIIVAALIVVSYVRHMGWVVPTYTSARQFKGVAEKVGVPLNPIAFTAVFSYILGICLVRLTWLLRLLGVALFLLSSVLTGSRAPIGVLVASIVILTILLAARGSRLLLRIIAFLVAAGLLIAVLVLCFHMPFKQMSALSEGRWDLWFVAWQKFMERPLLGYGYLSWRDDLVSRLPGEYNLTGNIARSLAGGYHNEYLTILAEQGLLGFSVASALIWFLLRSTWKLTFTEGCFGRNVYWPLFACIFLLLRGIVEIPGLFGYSQEPADYLAFILIAIVVSRLSVNSDHRIRTVVRTDFECKDRESVTQLESIRI